jgi:hypothetical protein
MQPRCGQGEEERVGGHRYEGIGRRIPADYDVRGPRRGLCSREDGGYC